MKTLKLTAEHFDPDNNYIGEVDLSDYPGHIEIAAGLGNVKFRRITAKGWLVAGSGIKAGEGIKAGLGIKAGDHLQTEDVTDDPARPTHRQSGFTPAPGDLSRKPTED
jgi:hypothetical protein